MSLLTRAPAAGVAATRRGLPTAGESWCRRQCCRALTLTMGLVDQRSLDFIFAASMSATNVGTAVSLLAIEALERQHCSSCHRDRARSWVMIEAAGALKPQQLPSGRYVGPLGLARHGSVQGRSQGPLLGVVKGCAHDLSAYAFEISEDLVGCHLADQQEKCGLSRVQACRHVLHKAVIEADVSQRTSDSPGRSPYRCTDHRHQKDQSDEHTPHGTRGRAKRGRRIDLVNLDSSIMLCRDDGIAKFDEIFLLHVEQSLPNFLRLGLGWEFDDDEIAHGGPPAVTERISMSSARGIRLQSHWCSYSRKSIHLSGEGLRLANCKPRSWKPISGAHLGWLALEPWLPIWCLVRKRHSALNCCCAKLGFRGRSARWQFLDRPEQIKITSVVRVNHVAPFTGQDDGHGQGSPKPFDRPATIKTLLGRPQSHRS